MIPSGYAQANLVFGGNAVPTGAEVVIGLDVTQSGATPSAVAAAVAGAWDTANVMDNFTTAIELREVRVKFGPDATGPSGIWTGAITGTFGENALPPNTSILARKVTAAGGRAGRGRMYLPGFREDQVGPTGQISGATASDIADTLDAWQAALIVLDLVPVVLHGANSPLSTPTPIIGWEVDTVVATQRRRLRR